MKKIAIIGVGLIGGSFALELRKQNLAEEIIGIGHRQESLDKALQNGVIDQAALYPEEGVRGADLVVLATSVGLIAPLVKKIIPTLAEGTILTDVGSTKEKIVREVEALLPEGISFVGAHPLAGSEKRGIDQARIGLFRDSVCVLTPGAKTTPRALEIVKSLWEKLGAKILEMKPEEHDFLLAGTSHLPHLVAAALVNLAGVLCEKDKRLLSLIAGGFRDSTRIAASSPLLWRDICLENKENIINLLEKFQKILEEMKAHLSQEKAALLEEDFRKAKSFRDKL